MGSDRVDGNGREGGRQPLQTPADDGEWMLALEPDKSQGVRQCDIRQYV